MHNLLLMPQVIIENLANELNNVPVMQDFSAGFMDGGIADNQGVESIMRANQRRMNGETSFQPFDLMIINDVATHYMNPLLPAKPSKNPGWLLSLTITKLMNVCRLVAFLSAAGLILNFFMGNPGVLSKVLAIILSFLFIIPVIVVSIINKIRAYIKGEINGGGLNLEKNFSPEIVKNLFEAFGGTPLYVLGAMIKDRINAITSLSGDMFMKRIRQLLYVQFMDEGRTSFRLKTNHAYDLSFSNDLFRRGENPFLNLEPNRDIQLVAQCAFEQATTLWYDTEATKNNNVAAIVACGQFNTCYNLLTYASRLRASNHFNTLSKEYKDKVNYLHSKLCIDYEAFKKDPFWLYNKVGIESGIKDFRPGSMADIPAPTLKPTDQFYGLR